MTQRFEPGTHVSWKRTAFFQYGKPNFPQYGKVIENYSAFGKVLVDWGGERPHETLISLIRPVPPLILLALQA